jgi:hypothetical protein
VYEHIVGGFGAECQGSFRDFHFFLEKLNFVLKIRSAAFGLWTIKKDDFNKGKHGVKSIREPWGTAVGENTQGSLGNVCLLLSDRLNSGGKPVAAGGPQAPNEQPA